MTDVSATSSPGFATGINLALRNFTDPLLMHASKSFLDVPISLLNCISLTTTHTVYRFHEITIYLSGQERMAFQPFCIQLIAINK